MTAIPDRRSFNSFRQELSDDNVFNGAAALAFYLTLAIFPALILLMAAIPYLPIAHVDQAIMDLLRESMPGDAAQALSGVVMQITSQRHAGLLSFGIIGTLWAASSGMNAVMQQLNITHRVRESRSLLRARATALLLSVLFILLVLGSLSFVVLGGVVQDWIGTRWGYSAALLAFFATLRWIIIGLALILAFSLIYHFGPAIRGRFRFFTPGSMAAAVLLALGSAAFSFYANRFADYNATYGSIGAVIALMLWLYLAGLAILVGSVINERQKRAPERPGDEGRTGAQDGGITRGPV